MTLLFLTKTKHGNKNQMLWNFTQQIKKSSGWLLQRTRHFQKIRNFKKTKTHDRKNDESAIGNFPTFTWWTFKKWLKTQSNQRSSNRSKNEKSFNPWSDGLTNGSFARWFSACDLCEKCKLWISFTRNEYLSVEFFVWIYLHFLTRLFRVSWKFENWSRMLNLCNQQQTIQKTQLTGLKNRIWFHSYWIKNDFHSWTQKWNLECHQKISKKLVIILNALVFLFVVKTMQGSWTKMWRVMFLKKSLRVQTPMTCSPPYSVTEIRSPFKNCKTAPELIKTNKKPNKNDVKTMSFFLKTKTDQEWSAFVWIANPQRLAIVFYWFWNGFQPKILYKTNNISNLVIGRFGSRRFHHSCGTPLMYQFSFARFTALNASVFSSTPAKSMNNGSTLMSLKSQISQYLQPNTSFSNSCLKTSNDISKTDNVFDQSLFSVFRCREFANQTIFLLKSIFQRTIACHRVVSFCL